MNIKSILASGVIASTLLASSTAHAGIIYSRGDCENIKINSQNIGPCDGSWLDTDGSLSNQEEREFLESMGWNFFVEVPFESNSYSQAFQETDTLGLYLRFWDLPQLKRAQITWYKGEDTDLLISMSSVDFFNAYLVKDDLPPGVTVAYLDLKKDISIDGVSVYTRPSVYSKKPDASSPNKSVPDNSSGLLALLPLGLLSWATKLKK